MCSNGYCVSIYSKQIELKVKFPKITAIQNSCPPPLSEYRSENDSMTNDGLSFTVNRESSFLTHLNDLLWLALLANYSAFNLLYAICDKRVGRLLLQSVSMYCYQLSS
jgi:hypothetical protein